VDEQDPPPAGGDDEPADHELVERVPIEAGAATGASPTPSPPPQTAESASRQAVAYRLLGAACALVGVLLVVGGLIALRGRPAPKPPAAAPSGTHASSQAPGTSPQPARTTPPLTVPAPTTAAPTTQPPTTAAPTTGPTTVPTTGPTTTTSRTPPPPPPHPPPTPPPPPAPAPRSPLTVLNNTTRTGLADQAAGQFRSGGWSVVKVGNFTGKIPNTTVYYDPGDAAQLRAARALAAQYPAIGRVLPRYAGLPDSVHGVIVVLAPDWP
jgi:LytR cell envelope-related transcriptional attenuator